MMMKDSRPSKWKPPRKAATKGLGAASEAPPQLNHSSPRKVAAGQKRMGKERMPVETLGTERRKLSQERTGPGLLDSQAEVSVPK